MTATLLPKAQLGVKKTTISASVLRELKPEKKIGIEKGSREESYIQKLTTIRDFFLKGYKNDVLTLQEQRKKLLAERRRKREDQIEEDKKAKKESKSSLSPRLKTPSFFKDIFSSIGNFFLYLAGGILFNSFIGLENSLATIAKILEGIGQGIQIFANVIGEVTNFIDSAYKGYDKMVKQISDITGLSQEQIDDFSSKFNKLINGTLIASMLILRGLPAFLRARNKKPPKTPTSTTTSRMRGGSNTGIDYRRGYTPSGQTLRSGSSISRFNNSMAKFLKGTADPGDIARLTRRGFFQQFKNIKLPSIKSFRPSGAAVSSTATGLLKGGATLGISILADMAVDSTFNATSKKISREQVKNLVKKFGVEDSLNKIRKRLGQEYDKPVAPWWMLGLMDKEGMGTGRYRDQKFINNEAYKLKYLSEKSRELSQAMVGDKSTQNIASLMDYADYEETTETTNNIIQPIVFA